MRIFHDTWRLLIVGIIFIVVPILAGPVPVIYHFITGKPMMFRNSKRDPTTHVASNKEMAFQASSETGLQELTELVKKNAPMSIIALGGNQPMDTFSGVREIL